MMSEEIPYSASEMLSVMSGRLLTDGQTVFAGVGIPLLAATLAQRIHGPGITILFEGGTLGPFIVPGELPASTNEQRCTRRANMLLSITDVLLLLQRGYVDVGFMGGAQIDRYGNLNSSFIGSPENPSVLITLIPFIINFCPAVHGPEINLFSNQERYIRMQSDAQLSLNQSLHGPAVVMEPPIPR